MTFLATSDISSRFSRKTVGFAPSPAPRPLPPSTRHARHTSLIRPPRRAANACAARAGSGFTCGAGPTIADLVLFVSLRVFRSGRLDGIPADLLDAYPRIGALLDAVARLPAVAAHYGQP